MGFPEISFDQFFAVLAEKSLPVDPGLSPSEFDNIEHRYGFRFPPDLREFLSIGVPVAQGWVNWRSDNQSAILSRLTWPLVGMYFDIKHNTFWFAEWGEKPNSIHEQYVIAKQAVSQAPVLIPVFSHRYLPDRPCMAGNPVFSVHQTDIIYYGRNLQNYLVAEFYTDFLGNLPIAESEMTDFSHIEFWSDVLEQGEEEWRKQNNL